MGKKYRAALEKYDNTKMYNTSEAVRIAKELAFAQFDESVEVAVHVSVKKGQSIRGTVSLPHQHGSDKRILVFAKGDKAEEARKAGATYVGDSDFIDKIRGGWMDFDVVVATPDMMKDVGRLGAVLGRRGLMPNPKTKTVTLEVTDAISELKKGRSELRVDKTGVFHMLVGKLSMSNEQLEENIQFLLKEIKGRKPADTKGMFFKSAVISSAMGPGIKLAVEQV